MSNQPLTLQYRPVDFETIVGQDHITSIIREQIAHDAAKANYLFFWPRGTGKTSTARIVAKALNCLSPDHGNPCNTCDNCVAIIDDATLDIVEIDAASHTGVDNVREEIIAKVPYQPSQLKNKVYIIDEVHMLSKGAFNALLKVMEEPPSYVTFILATTEIHKVPETIVSRCQSFQFHRVARDSIVHRLQMIAHAEGIKTDPDALGTIAKVSEGIMRDAVKYLDQVSVLGDVTADHVQSFLGMVDDEKIASLLGMLHAGDSTLAIQQVAQLQSDGVDMKQFATQILAYVDEHFLDNVSHMTSMAHLFGKILGEMKYYPYPLLVYKRYFGEMIQVVDVSEATSTKDSQTPQDNATANVVWSHTSPSVENQPSSVSHTAEKPSSTSTDYDAIKASLLEQLDSPTLTWLVEKYVMIDRVDDGLVKFVAINKIAAINLEKEATKQSVEKILSGIIGQGVAYSIETMTKEEYAAKLLD